MADIFISYKKENLAKAKKLVAALKRRGFDCWIDYQNIPVGVEYDDAIAEAITACNVMVIMLDQASQNSKHLKNELRIANDCNKTVIPFMLEDVMLKEAFLYRMSANSRVFAHENWDEAVDCLLTSLRKLHHSTEENETSEVIRKLRAQKICCPKCQSEKYFLRQDGLEKSIFTEEERQKRNKNKQKSKIFCIVLIAYAFVAWLATIILPANEEDLFLAKKFTLICAVLAVISLVNMLIIASAEWRYEMRRRHRVRKHMEVYHLTCKDCCHKFKKVIETDKISNQISNES